MIRSFPLENRRILWTCFTMVAVFQSVLPRGWSFLVFHAENLVGFLEIKLIIVWRPIWLPGTSLPYASSPSASSNSTFTISNYHWAVPTNLWLQQLLFQISYWLKFTVFTCLYRVHDGDLLHRHGSLMSPRKVTGSQFRILLRFR